jgi:hypothetical protein
MTSTRYTRAARQMDAMAAQATWHNMRVTRVGTYQTTLRRPTSTSRSQTSCNTVERRDTNVRRAGTTRRHDTAMPYSVQARDE